MGIMITIRHDPQMLARLNRIAGQVRGVARMVEDGRYCIDVLDQTQAIKAALKSVEAALLKSHVDHCVADALNYGSAKSQKQKFEELVELFGRYGK